MGYLHGYLFVEASLKCIFYELVDLFLVVHSFPDSCEGLFMNLLLFSEGGLFVEIVRDGDNDTRRDGGENVECMFAKK